MTWRNEKGNLVGAAARLGERRLKAGGSQDWLPHKACDTESTTCEEVSGEINQEKVQPETAL